MQRQESIAHLMQHGNLAVPCSRYGRDTAECAPVAYAIDYIVGSANGEPTTTDTLDYAMGLVVNDHDDVATLLADYGYILTEAGIDPAWQDDDESEDR